MKILYVKNIQNDQMFLVKWKNPTLGRNYRLIFDCHSNKWKSADNEDIYIPARNILDKINPIDLNMAGRYIDLYKDEVNFPKGIKKGFIKLVFENKMEKI